MIRILLLQCNANGQPKSVAERCGTNNQAKEIAIVKLADGLVPRYARTRGGGSSGVVVTEVNATR